MTDFAPLISNPKSLLLGAAAQFGIFGTYMGARLLAATGIVDFTQKQSAAISIIGGADGPTAIFVTGSGKNWLEIISCFTRRMRKPGRSTSFGWCMEAGIWIVS